MSKQPFFILAGGYDTKNVGDYAMLLPLREILTEQGCALKLLSRHQQEHLKECYGVAEILGNFEYETRLQSEERFFRGLNFGDDTTHLKQLSDEISRSEGVIIGGGRLLIDYTLDVMRGPLPYFALLVTLCRFLGTPVYIYAMTIIENKSAIGNKLLRFIVDNSSRISVRDTESAQVLAKIGCRCPAPSVIPDPAFCLNWVRDAGPEQQMDVNLVGVSVRPISNRWGGMSFDDYIDHMAGTVLAIQERGSDWKARGIPHQFYGIDDREYDDRYILQKIHEKAPFRAGYLKDEMLNLEEYRLAYSQLGALVGIRRHSFVFAALSNTPILPMAENPNASRLCRQLRTIPPLPLNYSLTEFSEALSDLVDQRTQIVARQNTAATELSSGLAEIYTKWLFE